MYFGIKINVKEKTMKKTISAVLVCVLLLGCVFALTSCGKIISGTYEVKLTDDIKTTYEFSMNKFTKTTTTGAFGFTKTETIEGKYEINEVEDGKFEITFIWEADGEEKAETVSFTEGEENSVEYIKLGGIRYDKQK